MFIPGPILRHEKTKESALVKDELCTVHALFSTLFFLGS